MKIPLVYYLPVYLFLKLDVCWVKKYSLLVYHEQKSCKIHTDSHPRVAICGGYRNGGMRWRKLNRQSCSNFSFCSYIQQNQGIFELMHVLLILFSQVIYLPSCFHKIVALLVGHKHQRPLSSTIFSFWKLPWMTCGVCTCAPGPL